MISKSMDMATNNSSCSSTSQVDEDYIDMELSSSSIISFYHNSGDFEFQMSSTSKDAEPTTSPADELFYKGKLLPLHLPPRLQMVQKILQNTTTIEYKSNQECSQENCGSISSSTNSNNAPLESCNISPSESSRVVSWELDPDEHFFEWSSEINGFIRSRTKKTWPKHLKKSSIGQKIKLSSAYLKSLFSKSRCCNNSCALTPPDVEQVSTFRTISKGEEFGSNKYINVSINSLFGRTDDEKHKATKSHTILRSTEKEMTEDGFIRNRRSFNGVIRWHSGPKSLSSSSTTSSSGSSSSSSSVSFRSNELQFLERSSSANSELEISIDEAIAHCKNSQRLLSSGKTASDFHSFKD